MGPNCSGLVAWKLDAILSHPAGLVQRSGWVPILRVGLFYAGAAAGWFCLTYVLLLMLV